MIKGCFSDWPCTQVTLNSFSSAWDLSILAYTQGTPLLWVQGWQAQALKTHDLESSPLSSISELCDSVQLSLFTFLSLVNPLFPSPLPESTSLHASCGWTGTIRFLLPLPFLGHWICNCPRDGPNWFSENLPRGSRTGDQEQQPVSVSGSDERGGLFTLWGNCCAEERERQSWSRIWVPASRTFQHLVELLPFSCYMSHPKNSPLICPFELHFFQYWKKKKALKDTPGKVNEWLCASLYSTVRWTNSGT